MLCVHMYCFLRGLSRRRRGHETLVTRFGFLTLNKWGEMDNEDLGGPLEVLEYGRTGKSDDSKNFGDDAQSFSGYSISAAETHCSHPNTSMLSSFLPFFNKTTFSFLAITLIKCENRIQSKTHGFFQVFECRVRILDPEKSGRRLA